MENNTWIAVLKKSFLVFLFCVKKCFLFRPILWFDVNLFFIVLFFAFVVLYYHVTTAGFQD